MKSEEMRRRFEEALNRFIPEQHEIVRQDGSFTLVNRYNVVINYGTHEQNHRFRSCRCGCGHGCGLSGDSNPDLVLRTAASAVGGVGLAYLIYLLAGKISTVFHLGGV